MALATSFTTPIALIGAFIAVASQQPFTPAALTVTMRCADGGGVEISQDAVRITCDRADLRVSASAIRNIALWVEPRFVIPLAAAPGAGIPVGHRHGLRLSVLAPGDRVYTVSLRVNQDDLIAGLLALNRLTRLPVFTERPDAQISAQPSAVTKQMREGGQRPPQRHA